MQNPKKKLKLGKRLFILFITVIFLFFMKNKINVFNELVSQTIQEMNFIYVKVRENLYVKRLNYISRVNDIKYLDQYIENNKKRDMELQKLKIQNIELYNLKRENENLRNMLEMKSQNSSEYIAADVAFVEKFSNTERLFIDKGVEQGIEINLPVLYNGYLIGKISKVGENYSEVMLLTNKHSKISVILNDSDTQILRGNGNGSFSIFNYNEPVREREIFKITTSGLSDLFLGGLKIGTFEIKDVTTFNQVKEMRFKPSYKVFEIKNVLVYKWNRTNAPGEEIQKFLENEKKD